jgi:hypothetical protein
MAHQITISWTASPGPISGYNVRRGTAVGNESSTPLNNAPLLTTSFTDNTVYPGQIYSYAVTAVYNGVESLAPIQVVSSPVPFGPSPAGLLLGAASSFGVLAGSTVTNVPGSSTLISGDVGTSPGTSITGFASPTSISGVFHPGDFVSAAAQGASLAAYTFGNALVGGVTVGADLGALTLSPGVYKNVSSVAITGTLVLDGGGNPNATWIFQIGTTLTTSSSNSTIALIGGAQASNVYWLVGSSATLNTNTSFAGNIIAQASITADTGVHINGRLFALIGAVTLDGNDVVLFLNGQLSIHALSTPFQIGQIIFDGTNYQVVSTAGTSGSALPTWATGLNAQTTDGSVAWTEFTPPLGQIVLMTLPPSLPNTPPAPPASPTSLTVSSES